MYASFKVSTSVASLMFQTTLMNVRMLSPSRVPIGSALHAARNQEEGPHSCSGTHRRAPECNNATAWPAECNNPWKETCVTLERPENYPCYVHRWLHVPARTIRLQMVPHTQLKKYMPGAVVSCHWCVLF